MLKRIKSKPFRIKEFQRFKTTRLDILVVIIVFTVFLIVFPYQGFPIYQDKSIPLTDYYQGMHHYRKDINGDIYQQNYDGTWTALINVNYQFFLGPIILIYEMFVLIILDGKPKGREIPFHLYIEAFNQQIKKKIQSGIQEYKERIK
jgi:hypothetical protein